MPRLACMLILGVLACLMSGAYGALHNQVSYTVSPEYFTKFKFEQFGISPALSDRQGAAIVGWQASWWMGIVIGMVLIPFGLLIRDTKLYFLWMLRVFALVILTAMGCGLLVLIGSHVFVTPSTTELVEFQGKQISDPAAFWRAGTLHNASYLGGFLGIVVGMASILKRFLLGETGSAKI